MQDHNIRDEILEAVWTCREEGIRTLTALKGKDPGYFEEARLRPLLEEKLIRLEGDDLVLTAEGEEAARGVIRRHRLAERLLKDVLNLEEESSEDEACTFEHTLTPGIVDSICTLLGHPSQCPHGLPIPEGECCRQARNSVEAIVAPLPQIKVGEPAVVSYISSRNYNRIKKLYSFGIHPGTAVTLVQRSPAVVVKVEETQVAIEQSVAEEIYVRRDG
ncbi:MAG: FeoA domain-containing protein [Acidobacteria bacterium]|nr:FeoA domain-containing protein [Acidobacteriota bacterium]